MVWEETMVPKPGCRQFLLSCECVSTWHKELMLDVKNLGVLRWWRRWELFILGKVGFFDRDNLRKLKRRRNLEAARIHSSTLAWKIPWAEEPGGLQSMGSLGVGHNWATSLSLFAFMHWRRKWQPTPVFLPGESQGWRSLVGCRLWDRAEWTRLKRLSSSSSSKM